MLTCPFGRDKGERQRGNRGRGCEVSVNMEYEVRRKVSAYLSIIFGCGVEGRVWCINEARGL